MAKDNVKRLGHYRKMLQSILLISRIAISLTQTIAQEHSSACMDKKGDLCWFYNDEQCVGRYEAWARTECPYRCGYCNESPPCVNLLNNCENFEDDLCTNPTLAAFARQNCRKYCNKCSYPGAVQMTTPTQILIPNVSDCKDNAGRDCWAISDDKCIGKYAPWARKHCAYRCGYCPDKPPCIDIENNCDEYGADLCTNTIYGEFARKNCRKYCDMCHEQPSSYVSQTTNEIAKATTTRKTPITSEGIQTLTDGIVCDDMLHNCAAYGSDLCVSNLYTDFARTFCRKFCFGCPHGNANNANAVIDTTICEDRRPNCGAYGDDLCTNVMYTDFVLQYCRKYCNKCII